MASVPQRHLALGDKPSSETYSLEERRTPELVLGFVGPVGSGVTFAAKRFAECLENEFAYVPRIYKISDIIKENSELVKHKYEDDLTGSVRISELQKIGNELREKFGPRYLTEKVVEQIAAVRLEKGYKKDVEPYVPLPMRSVHIIDSIKNPNEVKLLRDVYGETFYLIGIFCPEEIRVNRLKAVGIPEGDIVSLIRRDEDEGVETGQKVRDTIYDSDFFIRNDGVNDERLGKSIRRFLDVLFNISVDSPTLDEAAMYTAVSAAASSACLSRQVGAAIYSQAGELIGVGANDVPRFGGSTYRIEDGENDHRCYKWGGKICHNDDQKERIYNKIIEEPIKDKIIDKKTLVSDVRKALTRTGVKSIIEFSRAVHNCARHIVAAGISKVVYIEPYPKSLATELHNDAITVHETDRNRKVVFLQYEGIAPKNIIRFFKSIEPRKRDGRLVTRNPKTAVPVYQPPLDGFAIREQIVVNRLAALEGMTEPEASGNQGGGS